MKQSQSQKAGVGAPTTVAMFNQLIELVAQRYDVTKAFLVRGDRSTKTAISRQMAMYLCRYDIGMKFDQIAAKFDRSRPTVIRSVRKMEEALRAGAPNSSRINEDVKFLRAQMLKAGMPPRKPEPDDASPNGRVLTRGNGQGKSSSAAASKVGAVPPRKAPQAQRQSAKQVGSSAGKRAA